jgi:glutathione S-transferase
MKLYSRDLSPFAARVRLAIYAKSLPVEIHEPPGGTGSPDYRALTPIGKVPSLVLDDGTVLPESDTIMEYLADRFPDAGLRPAKAEDAARGRLLSRIADLYVIGGPSLFPHLAPEGRDQAAVDAILEEKHQALGYLNLYLSDTRYAVGDSLTGADCAVVPVLFFIAMFENVFGRELIGAHSKLEAYWASVGKDPHVQKVLAQMDAGLQAVMPKA